MSSLQETGPSDPLQSVLNDWALGPPIYFVNAVDSYFGNLHFP